MKLWTLLPVAALVAICTTQQDCERGACYPPQADLLLGRGRYLRASSTCGLTGTEVFCSPLGQAKLKCCPCDSRNPLGLNAHTIQNVVSSAGPNRWWQSQKGVSPVMLQLDLPHTMQLSTLVLQFKGPRPNALVIERSTDFGRTWKPVLYMAADCGLTFPHVGTSLPQNLMETYCYQLPPFPNNPYLDQTIHYSPLLQFSAIKTPLNQKVDVVSGFTGLRVNLTQQGHMPHLHGSSQSLFYALKEMRVQGSCFCHGHANRCHPETSAQVSLICDCQHKTTGVNCERCEDLYNDLPWRPAEEGQPHTCKRCECNNHAQKCRFNPALFKASGGQSGGMCEGCLHHTVGPHCEYCAPGYYQNPRSSMNRPDACLRCQCSAAGVEGEDKCDAVTGACLCKGNVEGQHCDHCKLGYYGLSIANPVGCTKCSCHAEGSLTVNHCDPLTGQCQCHSNVHGTTCDRCVPGTWNLLSNRGCEPCNCDPNKSPSRTCDQVTGQCQCRPGFGGRTCTECPDNTYGDPQAGCRPCRCDRSGAVGCDKRTGVCQCLPGTTGSQCDACTRGHCDRYPACPLCPACFFILDRQLQDLMLGLEHLAFGTSTLPGSSHRDLGPRLKALGFTLSQIHDTLPLPAISASRVMEVLRELRRLRELANGLDPGLFSMYQGSVLVQELEDLSVALQDLNLDYNRKTNALGNHTTSNFNSAFSTIQAAYRDSTNAMKSAEASQALLAKAFEDRVDAIALQRQIQLTNTLDLETLDQQLGSQPNLTPTAAKVCGSTRSAPCTPKQCDGLLCPTPEPNQCRVGGSCVGALPLGIKALRDTEEVKGRLQKLNGKITQTSAQIRETQDSANKARLTADELASQMKETRDNLEADMQNTRNFVKQLRDFLSDPFSDPATIQTVSEGILSSKLPLKLADLKRKVEEIRRLAATLPDNTLILDNTSLQLDQAQQLLLAAQNARDEALGVENRVEAILQNLDGEERLLEDLESKLRNSQNIVADVNGRIAQASDQFGSALRAIDEVADLTGQLEPQLEDLRALMQSGGQLAGKAQEDAQAAQADATTAVEGLQSVEKQMELLQKAREASRNLDGTGSSGERLQNLQEEATALVQETMDMMRTLAGQEEALKNAADQMFVKAEGLTGLDSELKEILSDIRRKASLLSTCQG